MPELGEIKKAREIGKRGGRRGNLLYIWVACSECNEPRWVQCTKGKPRILRCRSCARRNYKMSEAAKKKLRELFKGKRLNAANPNWKGGKIITRDGYIRVRVYSDSSFFPMVDSGGYIKEHRLVMAKKLGRCLKNNEVVHHLNGVKSDNRLKNLEVTTRGNHLTEHNNGYKDGYKHGYEEGYSQGLKRAENERNKCCF